MAISPIKRYLRRMVLRGWLIAFGLLTLAQTSRAQHDVFFQGFSGRMVSHSKNNASMAGPIRGIQAEASWYLSEKVSGLGQSNLLQETGGDRSNRHRFVGLGINGFDMGDHYRKDKWLGAHDSGNHAAGDYAKGGQVYSALMIWGEHFALSSRLKFRYQWGTGFSYHTQYFSKSDNPLNLAISTPINFAGQLRTSFLYDVSPSITLSLGGNITHFSNGNWHKPNVGYNNFHGNVGVWIRTASYRKNHIHGDRSNGQGNALINDRCYWNTGYNSALGSQYQLGLRWGRRMESLKHPGYFSVAIMEVNRGFLSLSSTGVAKHEWRVGLNGFYEGGFRYKDTFQGGDGRTIAVGSRTELGLFTRHIFRMGRLDLNLDLGVYLHRPLAGKTQFYNCLGFQYHITNRLIFQQRLKAHLNVADFLEWGFLFSI